MVETLTRAESFTPEQIARLGIVYQIAAEAGSETKRIIPGNLQPDALHGEYGGLIVKGLMNIAGRPEGSDCHGVTPDEAAAVLFDAGLPEEC